MTHPSSPLGVSLGAALNLCAQMMLCGVRIKRTYTPSSVLSTKMPQG